MVGVFALMVSNSSILSGTFASRARASRCSTALVEPPEAATDAMAFSKALRVMICEGFRSLRTRSITSSPQRNAAWFFSSAVAGMPLRPAGEMPMASMIVAMVLAVNWPPQAPAVGHAAFSTQLNSLSSILPARERADRLEDVLHRERLAVEVPWSIEPPYSARPGMSRRASAIMTPGLVLSQAERQTRPSR